MPAARAVSQSRRDAAAWGAAHLRDAGLAPRDAWVEADVLLRHAAGLARDETLMRPEAPLSGDAAHRFAGVIARRAAGWPSAYLTGRREFCGLSFDVDPRVLIPRPETEVLVDAVTAALAAADRLVIVDVGTGSGAIALALAHRIPSARLIATDVSAEALAVAQANAARLGLAPRVTWRLGDALDPLAGCVPAGGADAICANPPYVPAADLSSLPREVRDYEPRLALDGGPDGLSVHRRLAAGVGAFLRPGGLLAVETSALGGQARAVLALVAASGAFHPPGILRDYAGLERVVIARRKERPGGQTD
jgi:release factor glutamine methyltransferase